MPTKWNDIYSALIEYYEKRKGMPKPPIPLILYGWEISSNLDKLVRWNETIEWVNNYYPDKSIIVLKEQECYYGH